MMMISKLRVPWPLLVIVLLASTAAVSAAGGTAPATKTADLGGDGAILYEATDLSEAYAPPGLEEEMRSMESLLHWAICGPQRAGSAGEEWQQQGPYTCPRLVSSTGQHTHTWLVRRPSCHAALPPPSPARRLRQPDVLMPIAWRM